MTELPHIRHNRIAVEIALRIVNELDDNAERLLLLESIVSGSLKLIVKSVENPEHRLRIQQRLFNTLIPGIKTRLTED